MALEELAQQNKSKKEMSDVEKFSARLPSIKKKLSSPDSVEMLNNLAELAIDLGKMKRIERINAHIQLVAEFRELLKTDAGIPDGDRIILNSLFDRLEKLAKAKIKKVKQAAKINKKLGKSTGISAGLERVASGAAAFSPTIAIGLSAAAGVTGALGKIRQASIKQKSQVLERRVGQEEDIDTSGPMDTGPISSGGGGEGSGMANEKVVSLLRSMLNRQTSIDAAITEMVEMQKASRVDELEARREQQRKIKTVAPITGRAAANDEDKGGGIFGMIGMLQVLKSSLLRFGGALLGMVGIPILLSKLSGGLGMLGKVAKVAMMPIMGLIGLLKKIPGVGKLFDGDTKTKGAPAPDKGKKPSRFSKFLGATKNIMKGGRAVQGMKLLAGAGRLALGAATGPVGIGFTLATMFGPSIVSAIKKKMTADGVSPAEADQVIEQMPTTSMSNEAINTSQSRKSRRERQATQTGTAAIVNSIGGAKSSSVTNNSTTIMAPDESSFKRVSRNQVRYNFIG